MTFSETIVEAHQQFERLARRVPEIIYVRVDEFDQACGDLFESQALAEISSQGVRIVPVNNGLPSFHVWAGCLPGRKRGETED